MPTNSIILGAVIIIVIICIIAIASNNNKDDDSKLYDISNHKVYRNEIYTHITPDFKPCLNKLLSTIDSINNQVERQSIELSTGCISAAQNILNTAEELNKRVSQYWRSQQYNKDFVYYIGLHYSSHILANALKSEQQHLKNTFVECKKRQDRLSAEIDVLKKRQAKSSGIQRGKISEEIKAVCAEHQRVSRIKSSVGAINATYNTRVTNQNITTANYRDYIAEHFGKRGRLWKIRCKERADRRKAQNN